MHRLRGAQDAERRRQVHVEHGKPLLVVIFWITLSQV
jgi:hypothetical protein